MPAYSVGLRASAEKQLAALDKPVRERVAAAIDALAETPRPSGAIAGVLPEEGFQRRCDVGAVLDQALRAGVGLTDFARVLSLLRNQS